MVIIEGNQEAKITIEQIKADKVTSELTYFKQILTSFDRKIEEE